MIDFIMCTVVGLVCMTGRYGDKCERKCACGRNTESCDPATGQCHCRPGYFGVQCKQSEY